MTFNPPASIEQDRPALVHLRLSALTLTPEQSGRPKDDASIGMSMRAEIRGSDFEIEELSSEVQSVDAGLTEWRWSISTENSGPQSIHLLVTALATSDGTALAGRDVAIVDCTYEIQVDPSFVAGRFLSSQWQWLIGVLVIPLIGFAARAMAQRQAKRRRANTHR